MLAGIITESQYKEKMEEEEIMGKVGKSYPSPSTPEPIKNIHRVVNDIPRKKIFIGKPSDEVYDGNMIYFDDKDPFYSPLKEYNYENKKDIECLNRIPNVSRFPQPISENPNVTPLKLDLFNLYKILAGASPIIPLQGCPDYMNDEDGKYILIELEEIQGYISHGNVGRGLRRGTDYNLGMGFIFTSLDFDEI